MQPKFNFGYRVDLSKIELRFQKSFEPQSRVEILEIERNNCDWIRLKYSWSQTHR